MPGLYDSYRLSNSTVVPMYQGSAANDMNQVSQYLQGQYDMAREAGDTLAENSLALKGFNENDEALAAKVRDKITGSIKDMAARNDWENQVNAVKGLGRYYAGRAKELSAPFEQYQKWVEDEIDNKEKNLTPEEKHILKARAIAGYKGLQEDPSGRFSGKFTGLDVAKSMDGRKFVDEVMANFKPFVNADQVVQVGDKYIVKRGTKTETVSADRVQKALDDALASNPEMQAYMRQESENAAFLGSKMTPERISNENLRKAYMDRAAAQGVDFSTLYGQEMGTARQSQMRKYLHDYARTKYAYHNFEGTKDVSAEPWALAAYNKQQPDDFRIMGEGANTVPQWAMDPTKLTEEIATTEKALGDLNTQRINAEKMLADAKLKGNTDLTPLQTNLDRINKQIQENQKILDNNNSIWNNTLDAAVRNLNFDDGTGKHITSYKEFVDSRSKAVGAEIQKKFPKGVQLYDGSTLTPQQLTQAVSEGRIQTKERKVQRGRTYGKETYYEVRLPDGTVKNINDVKGFGNMSSIISINSAFDDKISKVKEEANRIHKDVSTNYSVMSNAIGLNDVETKALRNFGISSATIYNAPGSAEVNNDADIRQKEWVPRKYNSETGRFTGYFEDPKTHEKTADMDVKFNSNVASELRSRLAKYNSDGKWDTAIAALDDGAYSGILTKVTPGSTLTGVPDANGMSTNKPLRLNGKQVEMKMDAQGTAREWVLRWKNGDVITDENGQQMRTSNISKADRWLRILSNGK